MKNRPFTHHVEILQLTQHSPKISRLDLRQLLDNNPGSINWRTKYGHSMLMHYHDNQARSLLLERGADINAIDWHNERGEVIHNDKYPHFFNTALHWDIANEEPERALFLILEGQKYGIDLDKKDGQGKTPLRLAVLFGYEEVVKKLIEGGADVNARDQWQVSPLMAACIRGNLTIVHSLLEAGAELNACDINGKNALVYASGNPDITGTILWTVGLDPNRPFDATGNNITLSWVDKVRNCFFPAKPTLLEDCLNKQQHIRMLLQEKGLNVSHSIPNETIPSQRETRVEKLLNRNNNSHQEFYRNSF
ncbi:MAG: ankyrin repeat domain-containing protein [Alphaproteobacteria bacterium]|nr:ankyrin repeat domain-containing protein [Alphaproteobacteria bacterium]